MNDKSLTAGLKSLLREMDGETPVTEAGLNRSVRELVNRIQQENPDASAAEAAEMANKITGEMILNQIRQVY
jgi:HEPN domain-containing protein